MKPDEAAFESHICDHLVTHGGWNDIKIGTAQGPPTDFDATLGIDTAELFAFIGETQGPTWLELVDRLGGNELGAQTSFLKRLATQIDRRGTVDVLRHGVDDHGIRIHLAYFRPAHGLTPDLVDRYRANRLTVTRQLPYDPASNKTLDLALFINGLPVATAELKNPLTGQTTEDAIAQYRRDRDPRNITLAKRAVVHFAFDTETVAMTTRLAGRTTRFLPFNRGRNLGAGNPPDADGHRTTYLWRDVFQRDAWLDLFDRFIHVEQPSKGSRKPGTTIFPRYHQWDAVRRLEAAARSEGPGHSYLVQHSAGSGKSNTIAWLAHRLSNLHDDTDTKVFDKVIVITDRVVLDRQLQDTVYQFEHAHGVVERIETDSAQLAAALAGEQARIIITTLQKFPFVLEHVGELPDRDYALLIDEAHSSQTGEAAKELKRALGARDRDSGDPPGPDALQEALAEQVAARGRQSNLSHFAFTATPKGRTLELFGRLNRETNKHDPFHLYSMRQAIEEGFILDVLANYVTYDTYYRLEKAAADDPRYDTRAAQAAIARFVTLHETNLAQKAAVVADHFRNHVAGQIRGRAKAMVVCSSRKHAVAFTQALRDRVAADGWDPGVLVAFSGTVDDAGVERTEANMNGYPDTRTAQVFDTDDHRIMVVAEKFQTGFDQPLLAAMYVDKTLTNLAAVQTLSRLNRIHPDKTGTFVLDFRNDAQDIHDAFEPYYARTVAPPSDVNMLWDTHAELDQFGVLRDDEIDEVVGLILAAGTDESDTDRIHGLFAPAVERVAALDEEERDRFVDALGRFVRTYSFLSQLIRFGDTRLERDHIFCRSLTRLIRPERGESIDLGDDVELTHLRVTKQFEGAVSLDTDTGEVATLWGSGRTQDPEEETLSEIIEAFNDRFGTDWTENDRAFPEMAATDLTENTDIQMQAAANTQAEFGVGFERIFQDAIAARTERNEKIAFQILDDPDLLAALAAEHLPGVYARARVARQHTCPIGDLLGADREDVYLEYKSTLRWDIRQSQKSRVIERSVLKTVAAFANGPYGGTLLVGVADDGSPHGLEDDYATFSQRGERGDRDLWGQHLQNLLIDRLGHDAASLVDWEFFTVDGDDIARVRVRPAGHPVYERRGDEAIFWWRYPTGTARVGDDDQRRRIITRRFGTDGLP